MRRCCITSPPSGPADGVRAVCVERARVWVCVCVSRRNAAAARSLAAAPRQLRSTAVSSCLVAALVSCERTCGPPHPHTHTHTRPHWTVPFLCTVRIRRASGRAGCAGSTGQWARGKGVTGTCPPGDGDKGTIRDTIPIPSGASCASSRRQVMCMGACSTTVMCEGRLST